MRISVIPADNGGCGNYRLRWPAEAVAKLRPDWEVKIHEPRGDVKVGMNHAGEVVFMDLGWGEGVLPDLVVLQRTGTPVLAGVARFLKGNGVAVVVDFDDAMWCIQRANVAWQSWNMERAVKPQHWRYCDQVADMADLVTVTTTGLASRYGKHGRVEVLPNALPDLAFEVSSIRRNFDPALTFGWAGFTATHPRDCEISKPAAAEAYDADLPLRVVGDGEGAARNWGVPLEYVDDLGAQGSMSDYYAALSSMDVMLVGLQNNPFNQRKSYLKVLEAASQGVVSIAAANQPHRELARSGFPVLLAQGPLDWKRMAEDFINRPELLAETRERLRTHILGHRISQRAQFWAEAWERAVRRSRATAGV